VEGGARSALVAPITHRGQTLGVLGVHGDAAREWSDDEIGLFRAVVERVAIAADNIRLLEETQRTANRERAVADFGARIRAALDLESVLKTAVGEMRQALGLERAEVRLAAEEPDEVMATDVQARTDG
jgi:GAF domain-containing protein